MSERRHHRPSMPGARHFEAIEGSTDPAELGVAAERAATALVRGGRSHADQALVDRVVHLADVEGLDTLAELWSGAAADSLAGSLWRLYLLRTWVHASPAVAAEEFDRGRAHVPVSEVVSGVVEPPGPREVRLLVDQVLRGVVQGDFADTLFRAAAFARVTAAGRAHDEREHDRYDADLSAARLLTLAEQLERAARLELAGTLS
ncbi:hypothetical protein [Nocardioides aequoreus]|uniref:hypothetical protein n=1 Tax=Nocardioides aequoreus TaxID=397278 RepID=UPI0004C2BDE4|nr:hypothetical protein [Nocardioides aequoreus]